jgi:heme-degrading monooxygenase HmoA
MLVVLWEYDVRTGMENAFEALYGADGEWVGLFREHPGFIGTELLHGERPNCYLSIDRWETEQAYDAFLANASEGYMRIDAMGDAFTLDERRIGRYTTC